LNQYLQDIQPLTLNVAVGSRLCENSEIYIMLLSFRKVMK
jgi:hypothetical protein